MFTPPAKYLGHSIADISALGKLDLVLFDKLKFSPLYRDSFKDLVNKFELNILDLGHAISNDYNAEVKEIVEVNNSAIIELTHCKSVIYTEDKTLICCPNPNNYSDISNKNVTYAGFQRHLFDMKQHSNSSISLGQLSNDLSVIEPNIRNSKSFILDLDCIKASELMLPGKNPCGISIMQACKLGRYAGFSDTLKHFQIILPQDANQIQIDTAALILWYFIEGRDQYILNAKKKSQFTSFVLSTDELDLDLEFVKDEVNSKWWIRDPHDYEKLIPCSQSDYDRIMAGEDPLYLLNLIELV